MADQFLINLDREITIEKGVVRSATLAIERIDYRPERNDWVCLWKIDHLCSRGIAIGSDPLEALTNAIRALRLLIKGSEEDGYSVFWKTRGDLAGFAE